MAKLAFVSLPLESFSGEVTNWVSPSSTPPSACLSSTPAAGAGFDTPLAPRCGRYGGLPARQQMQLKLLLRPQHHQHQQQQACQQDSLQVHPHRQLQVLLQRHQQQQQLQQQLQHQQVSCCSPPHPSQLSETGPRDTSGFVEDNLRPHIPPLHPHLQNQNQNHRPAVASAAELPTWSQQPMLPAAFSDQQSSPGAVPRIAGTPHCHVVQQPQPQLIYSHHQLLPNNHHHLYGHQDQQQRHQHHCHQQQHQGPTYASVKRDPPLPHPQQHKPRPSLKRPRSSDGDPWDTREEARFSRWPADPAAPSCGSSFSSSSLSRFDSFDSEGARSASTFAIVTAAVPTAQTAPTAAAASAVLHAKKLLLKLAPPLPKPPPSLPSTCPAAAFSAPHNVFSCNWLPRGSATVHGAPVGGMCPGPYSAPMFLLPRASDAEEFILHACGALHLCPDTSAALALHVWRRISGIVRLVLSVRRPAMDGADPWVAASTYRLYATACLWLAAKVEDRRRVLAEARTLAAMARTSAELLCAAELRLLGWVEWSPLRGYLPPLPMQKQQQPKRLMLRF